MDVQFDDLSIPDPTVEYACSIFTSSTGFTHLMKLVLLVDKFPEAMGMIKNIILNNPEEINKQNNKGWSALMIVCRNCNSKSLLECAELLIDSGADVNLVENKKNTCLVSACCKFGDTSTYTKQFVERLNLFFRNNPDALFIACDNCNDNTLDCVKLLIRSGANIDLQNIDSCTALIFLCEYCHNNLSFECIKLLVESNSNLNLQNFFCNTPLISLCRDANEYSYNCMQLFIKKGANLNTRNSIGHTAIMILCDKLNNYSFGCIKLLIENGADINLQDNIGNTALHHFFINMKSPEIDLNILMLFIYKNYDAYLLNKDGLSVYDCYTANKNYNFRDEYLESLLQGKIKLSNTKSSRK